MAEVAQFKTEERTAEQELKIENFKLKLLNARLQSRLREFEARAIEHQLSQEKLELDKELGSSDWLK